MKKSQVLTVKEIKRLTKLGNEIKIILQCNTASGIPGITDRTDMIDRMIEYLQIHGYEVK